MKIAVIGGGTAGLMAAVIASEKHNVTLYERQGRVGKKLYASGNGKCNLTNTALTRENLAANDGFYNCREARDIVSRFDYNDLMQFCLTLGIETVADSQGRVYPRSENSGSVLDALRLKCAKNNVKISTETIIMKIERRAKDFKIWFGDGQFCFYDKVIFCVGSDIQIRNFTAYDLLRDFKLAITKTQTSLTPIKTKKVWLPLNGTKVKCGVTLKENGKSVLTEYGEVLFRDYGLSGIVIFNMSSYIARNIVKGISCDYKLSLDLYPELSQVQLTQKLVDRLALLGGETKTFFVGMLSNKLAEAIITINKFAGKLNKNDMTNLAFCLKNIEFEVLELCGTDKGQVMAGGIDFAEMDENLQSKRVEGLYFAGECINADGICGGFNIHFALASGFVAGKSV